MNTLFIRRAGRVLSWMVTACFAGAAASSDAAVSMQSSRELVANQPIAVVWHSYELQFHYFASYTYYNCSGLESRLKAILQQLGAAKDVSAVVTGCFGATDVGNMLSARIRVRMPVPAVDAPPDSFLASDKSVTLRSGRAGDSIARDCELLEQVREQILPALKLPLLKDDLNCIPGMASPPSSSLQVMALLPDVNKH